MALNLVLIVISLISSANMLPCNDEPSINEVQDHFAYTPRRQWRAREPTERRPLARPAPFVVLHHSYTPPACGDPAQCEEAMRVMQNMHMDGHGWADIGYNFAVGGDGAVYEGRGWALLGAHALHFNTVSLGVCLIGDWSDSLPPRNQLKAVQALIAEGVARGAITPNYRLVGHRQVRANTSCPGDALFNHIQTWKQYSAFPASWRDLVDVPELPKSDRDVVRRSLLEF
ncbi:peptidoglycan recognition protein 1-like isoform X1 [Plutella xylostella]|uniref:peptidoglycan recognition protein 1-like isoform X1 n=1 Tax=Plutella xylostella TaxID=51655 RepID=UPI00203312A9|nr:peptidoglycan recognition protein 1-like isoform X1 [Plutella xylostella]XP_048482505.1 peptidoglycan recognition protein 1-like isoform X1 [Plutella xylostella]